MFCVSVEQLMQYNDNANNILKLKMCFPQRPKIPLGGRLDGMSLRV